mmetsp:Transcript_5975/g.13082  ORF Transcript_5975/g.13082 Transcript_5975/m.13082 type:complete len:223 (-) Transcript_5975:81-749(-)
MPLPPRQALSRPQDALLRRGPLPLLHLMRGRRRRRPPHRRLLQQGEGVARRQQYCVHSRAAAAPAQGLRQAAHRLRVPAHDSRGKSGLAGEATIRPRPPLVPELLDASAAAAPARAPRQPLGQGDLRHHRHQDGGHHLHAPIAQPHQVLEGTARHLGVSQDRRRAPARQHALQPAMRPVSPHVAAARDGHALAGGHSDTLMNACVCFREGIIWRRRYRLVWP